MNTLEHLVHAFISQEITASNFVNEYLDAWRKWRDDENSCFSDTLSSKFDSIFSAADMYNPAIDRAEYELDEAKLRDVVTEIYSS